MAILKVQQLRDPILFIAGGVVKLPLPPIKRSQDVRDLVPLKAGQERGSIFCFCFSDVFVITIFSPPRERVRPGRPWQFSRFSSSG